MSPKLSRFFASVAMFFAAAAALPQCDSQFQYSGEYRASILDLSILDNDLWAASGYGAQLYDRSVDPPRLVATIAIPGVTSIMRASIGTAFAGGTSGITVLRHVGNTIVFVQNVPVAGLNDLLFTPATLYAATANGLVAFNVSDMSPSPASFPTSSPAVSSLTISGSTLYAADGDNTIEVFSIPGGASPQKLGTVASVLRATSVEATATRLYASDGIRTEVFSGSGASLTSLGTLPYPVRSLADLGSNVVMIAGADRQLRAIDATIPQNFVELFDDQLPPSGGTVNRVTSMQTAGGRVYAGGGDIGLTTYDVSHFAAPFPLRAYAIGATTSIGVTPGAFYVSLPGGGIQEMTRNSAGLTTARFWDATEKPAVQDATGDGFLLSSAGSALTLWTLNSTIPSSIASATFAAPIRSALRSGTASAVVLLQDGTLWTVDLSQQTPAPVRVANAYGTLAHLAHSDAGTAAAEVSSDGTATTVHFWSGTDLNATPADVRVPGAATALAMSGSAAAVFTFRGITLIDFTTSTESLLPGSNDTITTALAMSGTKVVAVTQAGTIRIWDTVSQTMQRQFTVPGSVTDIAALPNSTTAGVATTTGVATIDYGVTASQPAITGRTAGNAYYKKAVAGGTHLYLFDGRTIDIYNLTGNTSPSWSGAVFAPGTLDVAASASALFTLSNTGVVTESSTAGVQVRSQPLNEGSDVTPVAIAAAGTAPWVSFSKGCTTTGCEQRTDVLDPQSLVATASLPGRTVDVTTSGSHAFAIFDMPSEIRAYDIGDPLHPSLLASAPNDPGAIAIADDTATGTVYALADKVYAYSDRTLTAQGSQLAPQKPGTFADLLIDSGCATVAGRSPSAERYELPSWTPRGTIAVPGNIRSMLFASGRLIILTDYSIELWSRTPAAKPAKRRAAR